MQAYPSKEDAKIFARLKEGDRKMMEYVYDTYAAALYGSILKSVSNEMVAVNILEKSFIEAWSQCKTVDPAEQKFFTWMYTICKKMQAENTRQNNPTHQFKSPEYHGQSASAN